MKTGTALHSENLGGLEPIADAFVPVGLSGASPMIRAGRIENRLTSGQDQYNHEADDQEQTGDERDPATSLPGFDLAIEMGEVVVLSCGTCICTTTIRSFGASA